MLAPSGLLLARVATVPAERIWKDWAAILCVYWIAAVFKSNSRFWPWVSGVVVLFLLGIYCAGHVPQVLLRLGIG
ncbi:MAG: hypothetical protein JO332_08050 [Planctomycetaceae bacterium]|nr:hypothetical protein [Planctomycetaceae bacterium]